MQLLLPLHFAAVQFSSVFVALFRRVKICWKKKIGLELEFRLPIRPKRWENVAAVVAVEFVGHEIDDAAVGLSAGRYFRTRNAADCSRHNHRSPNTSNNVAESLSAW